MAGTCSVSSAIATSSSCTSKSLSDWWRLSATLGLNLYVDSLAARHSRTAYGVLSSLPHRHASPRSDAAPHGRQRVCDLEFLGPRAADRVRRRALARAGNPDDDNHAALGLDSVARLEVVLHRWAALQAQALLEPALACGINGVREPRNPWLSFSAKTRPFWLDFLRRARRGDGLDRLCKNLSMLAR